jgi:hypothetical protein
MHSLAIVYATHQPRGVHFRRHQHLLFHDLTAIRARVESGFAMRMPNARIA